MLYLPIEYRGRGPVSERVNMLSVHLVPRYRPYIPNAVEYIRADSISFFILNSDLKSRTASLRSLLPAGFIHCAPDHPVFSRPVSKYEPVRLAVVIWFP